MQANEKIEQLISLSKHSLKKSNAGKFEVYKLNLGDIVKKYEFPGLGKSATQVFEKLVPQDSPVVLLGYGPRTVVFRINNIAEEKGADATEIIEHLKKIMPDLIESGGGHVKAAAVRVREGYEVSLLKEIESFLSLK